MSLIYKSIIDTILKNIDIGIHVVDSSGKTIIYNQAMADMEGLDTNEVMGKS
ncbi:MAG TPA: PAS domain-containing protein, partial [Bacillota bacterium]|nr:PAS domain-containing protein [Bacillota bacterium]